MSGRFRLFWILPLLAAGSLFLTGRYGAGSQPAQLIWLIPLGLFIWTITEYVLHRFVFHVEIRSLALKRIINSTHLEHHEAPRDRDLILVQASYALSVSALYAVIIAAICRNSFWTAGILTGIWAGFLYYEAVHYRVHISTGNGPLLSWQRRAHFHHHFHDVDRCFGVTSPLWDYVFGTNRRN
jgi:sterol desaturase/sphingolipid hydroxylase (fatty acid hydroxylase superfamily)